MNIAALGYSFERYISSTISLFTLLTLFNRRDRSLLSDKNVDEEGRIRTRNETCATNDAFFDALQKIVDARNWRSNSRTHRNVNKESDAYKKPVTDIRRLVELADKRAETGKGLHESRIVRREMHRLRAQCTYQTARREFSCGFSLFLTLPNLWSLFLAL